MKLDKIGEDVLADGSNGSVELVGQTVIIRRKGFANILTQGVQGEKQFPLRSVTAVQYRSAGSMLAGLIQFSILGGREFRGGMLEATKDENAVMFTRQQEPAFSALRDIIQRSIDQPLNVVGDSGLLGELEGISSLYEKGHLTEGEFLDAKRRVLSRQTNLPSATIDRPLTDVDKRPPLDLKNKNGCLSDILGIVALVMFVIVGLLLLSEGSILN